MLGPFLHTRSSVFTSVSGSSFAAYECLVASCGIWFPNQGLNLSPLHGGHEILAAGPPGRSHFLLFKSATSSSALRTSGCLLTRSRLGLKTWMGSTGTFDGLFDMSHNVLTLQILGKVLCIVVFHHLGLYIPSVNTKSYCTIIHQMIIREKIGSN